MTEMTLSLIEKKFNKINVAMEYRYENDHYMVIIFVPYNPFAGEEIHHINGEVLFIAEDNRPIISCAWYSPVQSCAVMDILEFGYRRGVFLDGMFHYNDITDNSDSLYREAKALADEVDEIIRREIPGHALIPRESDKRIYSYYDEVMEPLFDFYEEIREKFWRLMNESGDNSIY